MIVYALWHGGISYAHGDLERDLERFGSIREAVDAYNERRFVGDWAGATFQYVARDPETVRTPCVEGSTMTLWDYDPRETGDPYPWKIITTGPRDGTRVEVA